MTHDDGTSSVRRLLTAGDTCADPTKARERIAALCEQAKKQPRADAQSAQTAQQGAAPATLKLDTTG